MQQELIRKLYEHLSANHPDLLLQLDADGKVSAYLFSKLNTVIDLINALDKHPSYIIEAACMNVLTEDLLPSKFNYIRNILQEEFPNSYDQLEKSGLLQFEIVNLAEYCHPVFDALNFNEANEDSSEIMYAITGTISGYLESSK